MSQNPEPGKERRRRGKAAYYVAKALVLLGRIVWGGLRLLAKVVQWAWGFVLDLAYWIQDLVGGLLAG